MKLSVSLPDEDVEFLDRYVREQGYASRSAAMRTAVRCLRAGELGPAYVDAWAEWDDQEAASWDHVAADGLS